MSWINEMFSLTEVLIKYCRKIATFVTNLR